MVLWLRICCSSPTTCLFASNSDLIFSACKDDRVSIPTNGAERGQRAEYWQAHLFIKDIPVASPAQRGFQRAAIQVLHPELMQRLHAHGCTEANPQTASEVDLPCLATFFGRSVHQLSGLLTVVPRLCRQRQWGEQRCSARYPNKLVTKHMQDACR